MRILFAFAALMLFAAFAGFGFAVDPIWLNANNNLTNLIDDGTSKTTNAWTFSVNPTLENAGGVFSNISVVAGTAAAGLCPVASMNTPIGYGNVVYRYTGTGEASAAQASGYIPGRYVTPDAPMSSVSQAESSLQIGAQNPWGATASPSYIMAGDASGIRFVSGGDVAGGTGAELITSQQIPLISINRIGYNLQYGTAAGGLSWLGQSINNGGK
jgi:hypothetical protein